MIFCSCLLLLPLFCGSYLTRDLAGSSIKAKFKEGRLRIWQTTRKTSVLIRHVTVAQRKTASTAASIAKTPRNPVSWK